MADNIELLQGKLKELSEKLATKNEMGLQYTKRVQNSLNTIKTKLTSIIADYKKNVQDIQSSTSELDKTKEQLARQQEKSKAALEEANNTNNYLQTRLTNTNDQLTSLKSQLDQSNVDKEAMQQSINAARAEVEQAKNTLAGSNAKMEELNSKLKTYDELVQSLVSIVDKIDNMSINEKELDDLNQLLRDTEDMFPKDGAPPGNEGGFFGNLGNLGNLFGGPSGAGAGAGGPSTIYAAPQGNAAGGPRRGNFPTGRLYGKGEVMPKTGGKTKRRKTMHRGGYINRLRTKKHRKYTRTNKRRSSRSSKSSSKSSKHSA